MTDIEQLLSDSPYHCDISEDGFRRLVEAPFRFGKALTVEKNGKLHGLMTWAFLHPHQVDGYLNKTRKIKSIDFMRNTGELWFIDFIAPYGNTREVVREFQKQFQPRYPSIKFGKMFRRAKGYDAKVIVRTK